MPKLICSSEALRYPIPNAYQIYCPCILYCNLINSRSLNSEYKKCRSVSNYAFSAIYGIFCHEFCSSINGRCNYLIWAFLTFVNDDIFRQCSFNAVYQTVKIQTSAKLKTFADENRNNSKIGNLFLKG